MCIAQFFDSADLIVYFDGNSCAVAREGERAGELRQVVMEDKEMKHEEEPSPVETDRNEKSDQFFEKTDETRDRGSWQDYMFFFKSASIWLFGLFLVATIVDSVSERAGGKSDDLLIFTS